MSKLYTQKLNPLIFEAVDKLVDFVKVTYGPAANKIIIGKGNSIETIDDGVETARNFELSDEYENAVVKMIREVAQRTNDRVGDGTTSSLIMLQALMKAIKALESYKAREVVADLQSGLEDFKKQITERAKQITTEEELKQVAYISFNNHAVSEVIAKIFFELGHDGIVTVEESRSMDTTHTIVKGLQFPRGFTSISEACFLRASTTVLTSALNSGGLL